ncbi:MAG: STAS/SEC14 domain-containing protein [Anaerolineae bacterium]|nr:STAS/SEC14 domain-containing protein [Anaerolineae bacterium]
MSESTFRIEHRPDNIIVVIVEDCSDETVQHWYEYSMADMLMYTGPTRIIYDMRLLNTISMNAVRKAIKLRRHPNVHLAYVAVLTTSTTVKALVNVALSVNAGGRFATFTEEDQAVKWLFTQVPD